MQTAGSINGPSGACWLVQQPVLDPTMPGSEIVATVHPVGNNKVTNLWYRTGPTDGWLRLNIQTIYPEDVDPDDCLLSQIESYLRSNGTLAGTQAGTNAFMYLKAAIRAMRPPKGWHNYSDQLAVVAYEPPPPGWYKYR